MRLSVVLEGKNIGYESTKFFYQMLLNIFFDFIKCSKLRKNASFDQEETYFLFQLRNIGEKVCRFVFGKFVKTCRELDM